MPWPAPTHGSTPGPSTPAPPVLSRCASPPSTTLLMVRADVRAGADEAGAWWMDEDFGPIEPRNIYGITKLAAEQVVKLVHREQGINVAILRTGRFFPEDDDTHAVPRDRKSTRLNSSH